MSNLSQQMDTKISEKCIRDFRDFKGYDCPQSSVLDAESVIAQ